MRKKVLSISPQAALAAGLMTPDRSLLRFNLQKRLSINQLHFDFSLEYPCDIVLHKLKRDSSAFRMNRHDVLVNIKFEVLTIVFYAQPNIDWRDPPPNNAIGIAFLSVSLVFVRLWKGLPPNFDFLQSIVIIETFQFHDTPPIN